MLIPLNLLRDQPLQQQLYDQLHGLIASARLQPGARMPSTRMLAEQFAISRITVLLTYERLIAQQIERNQHGGVSTLLCAPPGRRGLRHAGIGLRLHADCCMSGSSHF